MVNIAWTLHLILLQRTKTASTSAFCKEAQMTCTVHIYVFMRTHGPRAPAALGFIPTFQEY